MPSKHRPLIIGEVLFDKFPDGKSVLGGAPFNVAWNLQGFGLRPEFVSAVGRDACGDQIRTLMEKWGMSPVGLQSNEHPTGEVQVKLHEGKPTFDIVADRAYDSIQFPDFAIDSSQFSMLYHGSLAFRNSQSRATIRRLIAESNIPRFVDVNIRLPHFDEAWLPELLGDAQWVKLSDDELSMLTTSPCETRDQITTATRQIRSRFGGLNYLITCGPGGAYAITESDVLFADAPRPRQMQDTVGAGDAFASTTIFGLLNQWDLQVTIQQATAFASRVCEMSGATSEDAELYESVKNAVAV